MKKLILLLLLCVSVLTVAAGAAFVDMPTDPKEKQAMENAVSNGLIEGITKTLIKPYDSLTRAQMATVLTRCLGVEETADISQYPDVSPEDWYYESIQKAVAIGALRGDDFGMRPNDNITVEQGFLVLSRIFDLTYTDGKASYSFADTYSISDWARDGVDKIVYGGYWPGGGTLNPQSPMTRVQFAVLMDNLVEQYILLPGTYRHLPEGNVVVKAEYVNIKDTSTDHDIYIADSVEGTTKILNTTAERVVIRGGNAIVTGTYGWIRAICNNTSFQVDPLQTFLKDAAKDGKKGEFYADTTRQNCFFEYNTLS